MRKQSVILFLSFLFCVFLTALAQGQTTLSITGAVKQPLNLTIGDLKQYQSVRVQLNDVTRDVSYRGVFYYRGVPLRALLETASIEKAKENAFHKAVDLAILIRNRAGEQVAISWGEVFYRSPDNFVLATSAVPIMPHHDCRTCHTPDEYQGRLNKLYRKIEFPKLVASGDLYSDRSLEGISTIEVLDLRPGMPTQEVDKLFSTGFSISGAVERKLKFERLPPYRRQTLTVKHIGEGKGYHGINRFEGVSLAKLLRDAGIGDALDQVILISAPDGYRSLFSYGELFLSASGERVIMADRMDGEPLEKGGRFSLVPPDDLMLDRDVKAVEKVEVISLKKPPKPDVTGVGYHGNNLTSLEGVSLSR